MTTQEIHARLNDRAGKHISQHIVKILLDTFGQPVDDTNIEAFLRYAWGK